MVSHSRRHLFLATNKTEARFSWY